MPWLIAKAWCTYGSRYSRSRSITSLPSTLRIRTSCQQLSPRRPVRQITSWVTMVSPSATNLEPKPGRPCVLWIVIAGAVSCTSDSATVTTVTPSRATEGLGHEIHTDFLPRIARRSIGVPRRARARRDPARAPAAHAARASEGTRSRLDVPFRGGNVAHTQLARSGMGEVPQAREDHEAVHRPRAALHVHRPGTSGERGRGGSPGADRPCDRGDAAALLDRRPG